MLWWLWLLWWLWCGPDVAKMSLSIPLHAYAPHSGGRTPGSLTPGVPATPSPRQRRTLHHRGLPNCDWRSTPPGQPGGARKMRKMRKKVVQLRHCKITRTSNLVDELQQRKHRPPCQSTAPVSVKQLHHHSVDELKLRQLHELDENLLTKPGTGCVVTETSTTASAAVAAASICIPPCPGGELLKQSPCFPPPKGLHGRDVRSQR